MCPVCQLPLDLLKGLVSPNVHIADCKGIEALPPSVRPDLMFSSFYVLDESRELDLESCPDGGDCASRDLVHYAHYDHTELARQRLVTPNISPHIISLSLRQEPEDPGGDDQPGQQSSHQPG